MGEVGQREFFAGLAMHAMIVADTEAAKDDPHDLVRDAWKWADLMCAEEVPDSESPLAAGLPKKEKR